MNKDGCHNKQCGMFTDMMPATLNCAFVWQDGPKTGCDKYQTCEAVVPLNDLLSSLHEEFMKFDTLDEAYREWTPQTTRVRFDNYGIYTMEKYLRKDADEARKKCRQISIELLKFSGR